MHSQSHTGHIADSDVRHVQHHERKNRQAQTQPGTDRQTSTCSAGGASGTNCRLTPAWLRSLAEMIPPVDKSAHAGLLQYSSYSITPKAYASPSCTRVCISHEGTAEACKPCIARHDVTWAAMMSAVGHISPFLQHTLYTCVTPSCACMHTGHVQKRFNHL